MRIAPDDAKAQVTETATQLVVEIALLAGIWGTEVTGGCMTCGLAPSDPNAKGY